MIAIRNEEIKKILFITLTNIGDIILTTPVLSVLKGVFPNAAIDVIAGPNGGEIFLGHPFVSNFIVYDKFSKLQHKRRLIKGLRKNRYDLIVDLRNSLFPLLIGSTYRTPMMCRLPREIVHKRDEHLWRLKQIGLDIEDAPFAFYIDEEDNIIVENILSNMGVKKDFVVVSPGAKSHIKRWTKEGFASLCDRLIGELGLDVILAGDKEDGRTIQGIISLMKNEAFDLSSKLTLRQLGALIKCARLLITNDSAALHIGCALGKKVLAIFGPTSYLRYGPKGKGDVIIRKDLPCSPCEVAQCKKDHECMRLITPEEVFEAAKKILENIDRHCERASPAEGRQGERSNLK